MERIRQTAEFERLRVTCRVDSVGIIPKAQEILRLMDTKCRPGALGKGELCRTAVAFDLACRTLDRPVPHQTAVKLSGASSEAVYVAALGTAQRLLGVQRRYSCEDVAKSVGGKRVGTMATTELKRYKERFLASYPAKQVASIDLEGTVYAVSAFYLCAKKLKHPVDKQRLLDLSLVREAEFTGVCRSMLDLCYSTLGVSVADKPSAERLRQFEKPAALGNTNTNTNTTSNTTNGRQFSRPQGGAARQAPAPAAPSSRPLPPGAKRHEDGGGTSGRRSIPLSMGKGERGATPGTHIAALVRSIQAASQRKRCGGKRVATVEPGGSNEANDSLNDKTHRPAAAKRLRHPVPVSFTAAATAAATTAAAGAFARPNGASAPAAGPAPDNGNDRAAALRPPRTAPVSVRNPYAATAAAGGCTASRTTGFSTGTSASAAAAAASANGINRAVALRPPRTAPVSVRNPYAATAAPGGSTASRATGSSTGARTVVSGRMTPTAPPPCADVRDTRAANTPATAAAGLIDRTLAENRGCSGGAGGGGRGGAAGAPY
ncbi:unnamed protein product [Pylaiella littoralis]